MRPPSVSALSPVGSADGRTASGSDFEFAPAPQLHRCFLAFDYGTRRVGVATGNSLTCSARPLRTVAAEGDARFAAIGALIAEWQPDALVVGVPFHPDGAPHDNTRRAQRFARQLQGRFKLAVHEVDERYSTTEAHARIGGGRADVDAASASIILEQFLHSLPRAQAQPDTESTAEPVHAGAAHDD